jgi:hypothetical protein
MAGGNLFDEFAEQLLAEKKQYCLCPFCALWRATNGESK